MWLEIYGLDIYAKAAVLINADGFVEITEMDITADFTDIKAHLDNLLGGGNFGESINNLLNVMGGYIWDQVGPLQLCTQLIFKLILFSLKGFFFHSLMKSSSMYSMMLSVVALLLIS